MERLRILFAVPAIAALSATAMAQNVLSFLPNGATSEFVEECVPSPACGAPGVPSVRTFAAPSRPSVAAPLGAVCVDDRAGVIFATNGNGVIVRTPYPFVGSPAASGTVSLPIPAVVGTVTGMAVDPMARLLYLTNGTEIFQVDPGAGMAVLCSWLASPLNILSGLDYDPGTPGVLTAVSTAGEVAAYSLCGGLISVASPTYPWPGADAVGVARDRTDATGGAVFVLYANGRIFDHGAGALLRVGAANRVGLSFLPSPLRLSSGVSCAGAATRPLVSKLPVAGTAAFGLELRSIPSGTPFVMLLLGFPAVATPVPMAGGSLWAHSGMVAIGMSVPAGATEVRAPLSLVGYGPPLGFDVQWAVPCSASAAGFVLSDGLQVEVGR